MYEDMEGCEKAFWEAPNDGSLDKPDAETLLREGLPALALSALLSSAVPECLSLEDGREASNAPAALTAKFCGEPMTA